VLALTKRGEVYACGRNHRGQSASGPRQHQLAPGRVSITDYIVLFDTDANDVTLAGYWVILTTDNFLNVYGQIAFVDQYTPSSAPVRSPTPGRWT
jgi:alpha-tubulin suppressor-like RCC1 family protein